MVEVGVYENPWLYEGKPFTSNDIDEEDEDDDGDVVVRK